MDKREEAAKYGRLIHEKGLVIGAGGNISVRDGDFFVIKKQGADMSDCAAGGYARIPFDKVEENKETLSTETPLHIACYRASREVNAILHVHSPLMIAAAEKTDRLVSTSYEFDCILKKAVPIIDYIQPGSALLAKAVAEKVASGATAVMMRRHGSICVGKDLEEAYLRVLALERACLTRLHTS
ncbi:MAG: class II aldolase/adducin family protein [Candidatus Omnitrophota bacterium]